MEKLIAYYCGPALAGIKPANIVACDKGKFTDINSEVNKLNSQLNCKDIYFRVLCDGEKKTLLIVYRSKILKKYLANDEIRNFLQSYGYPSEVTIDGYICYLASRLKEDKFPHEIGAFLGYPLHDILGFINHKNEGCLLVGEWKVYKNADEAQKLFDRFLACRRAIAKRMAMGQTLAQVFCAV